MSRKSVTTLARYLAIRRAKKKAGQAAKKQPQELEVLVREYGLVSEEEKQGMRIAHDYGHCNSDCIYCKAYTI